MVCLQSDALKQLASIRPPHFCFPTCTLRKISASGPCHVTMRKTFSDWRFGCEQERLTQSQIGMRARHSAKGRDVPRYGCGKNKPSKALESPLKPAGSELSRAEEKKRRVVARALSPKRDRNMARE